LSSAASCASHTTQNAGLVPIVEPEILLDGDHDIGRCLEVAEATWAETFKYLADNKVRRACRRAVLLGGASDQ